MEVNTIAPVALVLTGFAGLLSSTISSCMVQSLSEDWRGQNIRIKVFESHFRVPSLVLEDQKRRLPMTDPF